MVFPAIARGASIVALVVAATAPAAQGGSAHQHGLVSLSLAVDAAAVTLQLHAPLDSLLGFERAPRTDAERKLAAALIDRLRDDRTLVRLDAAAQCTLHDVAVNAPVLVADARRGAHDEHADVEATYAFRCAQPAQLRSLDLSGLLGAYKRIARVELQMAGSSGQTRQVLRRPNTMLRWGR